MPGEELAQGGAVTPTRDVGVQALGDNTDQRVGGRDPVRVIAVRRQRQAREGFDVVPR